MTLVTFTDNGKDIGIFLGERLEVRLPESQVSGYMWEYKEDSPYLRLDDSEYVERGSDRFTGLGERSWYFTPTGIGECRLVFSLIRPWSKPIPEFIINVAIK